MQAWLRFGLPMGSALILLTFLEATLSLFYLFIDFGGSVALEIQYSASISGPEIVLAIVMIIQILSTFIMLGYGVVLKGEKYMMVAWMATTAITAFVILAIIIVVVAQFSSQMSVKGLLGLTYSTFFYAVYVGYIIHFGFQCLPDFGSLEVLSPCGKGLYNIVSYFKSSKQDAAMLAVMSEIVLNTELFLERQVLRFVFDYEFIGHERDNSAAILTEETILRFLRIILGCLGFFLIIRGKQQWLLKWCIAYSGTIVISIIIFMYLIFAWSAEHMVLTLNYYILLLVNLFYRSGVLYVCLAYTGLAGHATLREIA